MEIRIDATAPEIYLQFDPTADDLLLFGTDAASGTALGPVAPVSVAPVSWGQAHDKDDDDDDDGKKHDRDDDRVSKKGAELRTYRVTDLAGNTTTVLVRVHKRGSQLKAELVSLTYGAAAATLPDTGLSVEWSRQMLTQRIEVGRTSVTAIYNARQDRTVIHTKGRPVAVSGRIILRLVTAKGQLTVEQH